MPIREARGYSATGLYGPRIPFSLTPCRAIKDPGMCRAKLAACARVLLLALLAAQSGGHVQAEFPPITFFDLNCTNGLVCASSGPGVCVESKSFSTTCAQGIPAECVGHPVDMHYELRDITPTPQCLWNLIFNANGVIFRVDPISIVAISSCPAHSTLSNGACTCVAPFQEADGACGGGLNN